MIADVSGQPVAVFLKGHLLGPIFLDYLTVEDEIDRSARNIGNQPLTTLPIIPKSKGLNMPITVY
jgi:hypothetical protein